MLDPAIHGSDLLLSNKEGPVKALDIQKIFYQPAEHKKKLESTVWPKGARESSGNIWEMHPMTYKRGSQMHIAAR